MAEQSPINKAFEAFGYDNSILEKPDLSLSQLKRSDSYYSACCEVLKMKGEDPSKMSRAEIVNKGVDLMRWAQNNIAVGVKNFYDMIHTANDQQKLALLYMMKGYENSKMTADGVWKATYQGLADPTVLAGVAAGIFSFGAGAVATQVGRVAAVQGLKVALEEAAERIAVKQVGKMVAEHVLEKGVVKFTAEQLAKRPLVAAMAMAAAPAAANAAVTNVIAQNMSMQKISVNGSTFQEQQTFSWSNFAKGTAAGAATGSLLRGLGYGAGKLATKYELGAKLGGFASDAYAGAKETFSYGIKKLEEKGVTFGAASEQPGYVMGSGFGGLQDWFDRRAAKAALPSNIARDSEGRIAVSASRIETQRGSVNLGVIKNLAKSATYLPTLPFRFAGNIVAAGWGISKELPEAFLYKGSPYKWAKSKVPGFILEGLHIQNLWEYWHNGPIGHNFFGVQYEKGRFKSNFWERDDIKGIVPEYKQARWQKFVENWPDSWPFKGRRDFIRNIEFSFFTAGRHYLRSAIEGSDRAADALNPLFAKEKSINASLEKSITDIAKNLQSGKIGGSEARHKLMASLAHQKSVFEKAIERSNLIFDTVSKEWTKIKPVHGDTIYERSVINEAQHSVFEKNLTHTRNQASNLVKEANTRLTAIEADISEIAMVSDANLLNRLQQTSEKAKRYAQELAELARPTLPLDGGSALKMPSLMQNVDMRLRGDIPPELNGISGSDDRAHRENISSLERQLVEMSFDPHERLMPITKPPGSGENSERIFIEIQNAQKEIAKESNKGHSLETFIGAQAWQAYQLNRREEALFGLRRYFLQQGGDREGGTLDMAEIIKKIHESYPKSSPHWRGTNEPTMDASFNQFLDDITAVGTWGKNRHSSDSIGGQRLADLAWYGWTNDKYIASRTPQFNRIAKVYAIDHWRNPRNNAFTKIRSYMVGDAPLIKRDKNQDALDIDWKNHNWLTFRSPEKDAKVRKFYNPMGWGDKWDRAPAVPKMLIRYGSALTSISTGNPLFLIGLGKPALHTMSGGALTKTGFNLTSLGAFTKTGLSMGARAAVLAATLYTGEKTFEKITGIDTNIEAGSRLWGGEIQLADKALWGPRAGTKLFFRTADKMTGFNTSWIRDGIDNYTHINPETILGMRIASVTPLSDRFDSLTRNNAMFAIPGLFNLGEMPDTPVTQPPQNNAPVTPTPPPAPVIPGMPTSPPENYNQPSPGSIPGMPTPPPENYNEPSPDSIPGMPTPPPEGSDNSLFKKIAFNITPSSDFKAANIQTVAVNNAPAGTQIWQGNEKMLRFNQNIRSMQPVTAVSGNASMDNDNNTGPELTA